MSFLNKDGEKKEPIIYSNSKEIPTETFFFKIIEINFLNKQLSPKKNITDKMTAKKGKQKTKTIIT